MRVVKTPHPVYVRVQERVRDVRYGELHGVRSYASSMYNVMCTKAKYWRYSHRYLYQHLRAVLINVPPFASNKW